jgi:hypothetical protein
VISNVGGIPLFELLAIIQYGQLFADLHHEIDDVVGDDQGDAVLGGQAAKHLRHLLVFFGTQARGRLVQEEQGRF